MSAGAELRIRPATAADRDAILTIIEPVIRAGETYALSPDLRPAQCLDYWIAPDRHSFVAEVDGRVLGTYYLRANQQGGGAHVANCGYMTHAQARGRGVARSMCRHSLEFARNNGFRAMQFNFVVASNAGAVALWQELGFVILCRLPAAFLHPALGYVDALVMYQSLT